MEGYKDQFGRSVKEGRITRSSSSFKIKYFEDAKKESHIARYAAIKTYTERRLEEIFENARKFVAKTSLIIGG